MLSGITMTVLYPRPAATIASPIPVFPEVGSIITPPGFNTPRRSASSSMALATRSLALPAGFKYSSFASTRAPRPSSRAK